MATTQSDRSTRIAAQGPAALSWPATPDIDGFTWELGPEPDDRQDSSEVVYREIPGYPGYHAGDDGTVWSSWNNKRNQLAHWRQLKQSPTWRGYMRVYIRRHHAERNKNKVRFVHHLVLMEFVGPRPEGMECRHLDGQPWNNRLSNIAWGTPVENAADKKAHGTEFLARGERNGNAKLTKLDVLRIEALSNAGIEQQVIGRCFGITQGSVSRVLRGDSGYTDDLA